MVICATYIYSQNDRTKNRPPPIKIASYEKITIDNGSTPIPEEKMGDFLNPVNGLKSAALSTSTPSSPMRSHSRVSSSRLKRDD
jgi:UDP-sugar transporter A1/2/3